MATFPIRCFTCGKPINSYYNEYIERKSKGEEVFSILDDFRMERMCCRRMFISHATEKLENLQLEYPTREDRVIEVGVGSITFQESRKKVEEIWDEDNSDSY